MANITKTAAANFIPQQWSKEVIASHLKNKVMAALIRNLQKMVRMGDQVNIPKPGRSTAAAKVADTDVTFTSDTAGTLAVSIDRHFYAARKIEDFAEVLALSSMRRFYTDDLGEALAQEVDVFLHSLGANLGGGSETEGTSYSTAVIAGDGSTIWDGSANANQGNGTAFTDAGFRGALQILEDAAVPMDLNMVVPPVAANVIRGIDRYNSSDFVNSGRIVRGQLAPLYGVNIVSSQNCATVLADDTTTEYRAALLFHRDAFVHIEARDIQVQQEYVVRSLATELVADTIYGARVYRPENGIALIMPK